METEGSKRFWTNEKEEQIMKKRVLALLLALTMTLALAACGSNGDDGKDKIDAPPVDRATPPPSARA